MTKEAETLMTKEAQNSTREKAQEVPKSPVFRAFPGMPLRRKNPCKNPVFKKSYKYFIRFYTGKPAPHLSGRALPLNRERGADIIGSGKGTFLYRH